MDSIIPPLTSAAVIATLMQMVKNWDKIPWINRDTGRMNALISIILAGFTTVGLSYDTSFDAASGAFTLGFHGTIGGLVDGLSHWLGQWTAQHAFYKGFLVPAEAAGEMRAILKQALLNQPPQSKKEIPPTGLE
jgi:hypothetical protein